MANGYCLPILTHIEALAACNPAKKLDPLGFTTAVLNQEDGSIQAELNAGYENGHARPATTVIYKKRILEDEVSDTPNACDAASTPAKLEFTLPALHHKSISFWMPDDLLRQYCSDVSQYVKINGNVSVMNGDTQVMKEVYDDLINYGRALLKSINTLLVTQASTQFGINVTTGSSDATQVNFSLKKNGMQDAFVRLMSDMRENEICDNVTIVGNGDFANIELVRKWFANAGADNGINKAAMVNDIPKVYFDKSTKTIWGENHIGVFEAGSLGLITRNMYVGNFARRLANSEFFSMALPVAEYCCPQDGLDKLMFDIQIRQIDCPTELLVNGSSATVSQGLQVIMSWNGSLFVKPDSLYEDEDELAGTLRYEIAACDTLCEDGSGFESV
jgi:hypothetical protein